MNVKETKNERTQLLNYLWEFQNAKGYISTADIRTLSRELGVSWIEIEGVISFYHFFKRKPTGKYTIYLNDSMICQIKGFQKIKNTLEKETGAKFGKTDPSGTFSLFETSCIGLSDQEPAALINFVPFVNLTPKKVKDIISHLRKGGNINDIKEDIPDFIRYKNDTGEAVLFREYKEGESILKLVKKSPQEVIQDIKDSGLTGRGGAFFPTGLKWEFARHSQSIQKYIICNADEGEPGTFKDRVLMNQMPGLMLEGMIIAGYAIGASKGFIYLRAEYWYLKEKIEESIQHFYKIGLLGDNILGKHFDFDISIVMGAGAYVCGEETALIESMEGNRGAPRTKVYFPVERGFLEKPTLINNVETLCVASRVMECGSKVFSEKGTEDSTGTKLLSISGDCDKPGIYEIEWGMTIQEMLDLCGAKDANYIQFNGFAGTIKTKEDFNHIISGTEIGSKLNPHIRGGGSVMIFNSQRDVFDILTNFSNFFINESCGLCTPCRAGNYLIGKRLDKIKKGEATIQEIEEIKTWGKVLRDTSRCGLGKTSTNFIVEAIDKFPELFKEKGLKEKKFNITAALNDYYDYVKNN